MNIEIESAFERYKKKAQGECILPGAIQVFEAGWDAGRNTHVSFNDLFKMCQTVRDRADVPEDLRILCGVACNGSTSRP